MWAVLKILIGSIAEIDFFTWIGIEFASKLRFRYAGSLFCEERSQRRSIRHLIGTRWRALSFYDLIKTKIRNVGKHYSPISAGYACWRIFVYLSTLKKTIDLN